MAKKRKKANKYKLRYQKAKCKLDTSLWEFVTLKEDLADQVDEQDRKQRAYTKKYLKFVQAIDDLDKIVGHLAEADDVCVLL